MGATGGSLGGVTLCGAPEMREDLAEIRRLPDTDPDGRKSFGMNLFLLSSTMMFGGLLLLYGMLRKGAPLWPPEGATHLPLLLPALATVVILGSSLVLERGVRAVVRARPRQLIAPLCGTILLGLLFVALELRLWTQVWARGLAANEPFGSTFYLITSFHGLHVVIAIGLLLWLLRGAVHTRYHGNDHVRVRLVARFWHFLGVNWALIFVLLFVL